MDYTYKKVMPEDVYVSMHPIIETIDVNGELIKQKKCPNKISGVEFMDLFAHLVWEHPTASAGYYAHKMGLGIRDFATIIRIYSGLTALQWRDRYFMPGIYEMLMETNYNVSDVAKKLGFSSIEVFNKYFTRHNKCSPKAWRYRQRGFNVNKKEYYRMKVTNAGL